MEKNINNNNNHSTLNTAHHAVNTCTVALLHDTYETSSKNEKHLLPMGTQSHKDKALIMLARDEIVTMRGERGHE